MNTSAVLKQLDRVTIEATREGVRYDLDGLPGTAPVNSLLVARIIVRDSTGGLVLRLNQPGR